MGRLFATLVAFGLAAGGTVLVGTVRGGAANVTCGANLENQNGVNATGELVNPIVDTFAATVKGEDVASATLTCLSLSGDSFTTTLVLHTEYEDSTGWHDVSTNDCLSGNPEEFDGADTGTDPSASFSSVGPNACSYSPSDAAANKTHRAELDWQVSEGATVVDSGQSFSMTWFMPVEMVP